MSHFDRYADCVVAFLRGDRTPSELNQALGLEPDSPMAYRCIDSLHDRGAVFVRDWVFRGGRFVPVYAFQHLPYFCPDVPKPQRHNQKELACQ